MCLHDEGGQPFLLIVKALTLISHNCTGKTYLGIAKVEIDSLSMSNVEDAIWFRGKPSYHLEAN